MTKKRFFKIMSSILCPAIALSMAACGAPGAPAGNRGDSDANTQENSANAENLGGGVNRPQRKRFIL